MLASLRAGPPALHDRRCLICRRVGCASLHPHDWPLCRAAARRPAAASTGRRTPRRAPRVAFRVSAAARPRRCVAGITDSFNHDPQNPPTMNRFEGRHVVPLEDLRMTDVDIVGGKNASLGEMISQLSGAGVKVPGGFATTAHAFREFLTHNRLTESIADRLAGLEHRRRQGAGSGGRRDPLLGSRGRVPAAARRRRSASPSRP